jgi:AcrR family transcriptional regulator
MRRIAQRLDVTTMALYRHVERKEEVLDLIVDAVWGEVALRRPVSADWRAHLHRVAVDRRAMLHRHPWVARLVGDRAALGPNVLEKNDYLLEVVGQLGLDVTTNVSILALFNAYIVGFVLGELGEREAQRRSGLSKPEWQRQVAPYVQQQIIASGRYPHLTPALVAAEERSADETFVFGLVRVLDGIADAASSIAARRGWPSVANTPHPTTVKR